MSRTLLVGAGRPRAVLLEDDRVAWVGDPDQELPAAHRVVDLGGACVTPAFVDAHVHLTATGLGLAGADLAGCRSAAECLDRVRRQAARLRPGQVLIGTGWDDFGWPEGGPPTTVELADAAGPRPVLLVRVDGHSCLVDPATLAGLPLEALDGVDRDAAGEPTGRLREAASEAAQAAVRAVISQEQVAAARLAACHRAAELGIASLHEMGHPGLSGPDDARAWAAGDWPVEVLVWWAELDFDACRAHGLRPGGDLFLDGSIGSCTAATTRPYGCGDRRTTGALFHSDEEVGAFFVACTEAGAGAGVHAIGDRAIEQACTALEHAAEVAGPAAVRACRHRVEHAELADRGHVRRMARLGVVASLQPAFDATWGGDEGLYAARFGVEAARATNAVAWFAAEGVPLAFSSDSPVTPLDPWGAVLAAERHRGGWGIDRRRAMAAHTRGGRYAAGQDHVGALRPGQRADLAVWSADPLAAEDPRRLRCLATFVRGVRIYGDLPG